MGRNSTSEIVRRDRRVTTAYAAELLAAAGASAGNAGLVAEHLVASDLRGVHSHGLLRVPQYVAELEHGELDGTATPTIVQRRGSVVVLDGRGAFGQVAAAHAVEEAALAAAASGIGLAATTGSGHAGRIGAYTEALAERGFLGLAFCSGPKSGHRVAPVGAIEGRLSTNPISFAFPGDDGPVVADFSTSTIPEGVARRLRDLGLNAPAGALQDAGGRPTLEPSVLYAEPAGTILPLGSPTFGHKGYALGILVEAMTTVLAGEDVADATRFGNNVTLVAIALDEAAVAAGDALVRHLRATKPLRADVPVLLPGDPERQLLARGDDVEIDSPVWGDLAALAARYGIDVPPLT